MESFLIAFLQKIGVTAMTEQEFISALIAGAGVLALLLLFLLVLLCKKVKKTMTKKTVAQFFGISDLSKFKVQKMGKPGTKYYMTNGFNAFGLGLPYWKKANPDGSQDTTKHFNKVIWQESVLWLHAGQKVFVLTTKDPWDMLFLVHQLRSKGYDIFPCQQELDKQAKLEFEQQNRTQVLDELVLQLDGDRDAFVALCRDRLKAWNYLVSDAPLNQKQIDLFLQKDGRPGVASCLLLPRNHLISLNEMTAIKNASLDYAESCTLITTGRVTVVAARYAMDNDITIIHDADLVTLLQEDRILKPGEDFLRWELNQEDMQALLPGGILARKFS